MHSDQERWPKVVPEKGQPHPIGCSQRMLVWSRISTELKKRLEVTADESLSEALGRLTAMGPKEVEHCIFRLRPKHKTFLPDRPWVWTLVIGVAAPQCLRGDITTLPRTT